MSTSTVTATRTGNVRRVSRGVGRRVRRALAICGWLALLLGAGLGYLEAKPEWLNAGLTLLLDSTNGLLGLAPNALAPWLRLPVNVPAEAVALVGIAFIGLFGGALAGLLLSGTSGLLRLAVALFAVLIGLVSAEITRGVLLGLPLSHSLTRVSDGLEALQIGLGALGAMLGVRTGRQPVFVYQPSRQQRRAASPAVSHNTPVERVRRAVASISVPSLPSIRRPGLQRSQPFPGAGRPAGRRGRNSARPTGRAGALNRARPPANRRRARRAQNVHLGATTSGVCPYCLEEVKPRDPRGRVECAICGTPHHGDCWAVTGKCEVPHLQP